MTYLEVLQRVQKVINSCVTEEQVRESVNYTKLVVRRWTETNKISSDDHKYLYRKYKRDCRNLADDVKQLRYVRLLEVLKNKK